MVYSKLSLETLIEIRDKVQAQIDFLQAAGKGFYKVFEIGSKKASYPCTYKQIQYAESLAKKTESIIDTTSSQLLKYFESEEMSEAIDLMKEGKVIKISK